MQFQEDQTTQQDVFFAQSYRDLVPTDDELWSYIRLFDSFNLSIFNEIYSIEGQVPIDPRLMLRTLFYGLQKGLTSNRKLAEASQYDLRFIILSGARKPDRRTFDRFILRHEKSLEEFFRQTIEKAINEGLVCGENVAVDGSRLKGNAKSKGMSHEKMVRAQEHIKENLKKLKEEVVFEEGENEKLHKEIESQERKLKKISKAQEQIEKEDKDLLEKSKRRNPISERKKSLNDPEALEMSFKNNSRAFMFGHNVQIAVDEKSQIIVAAQVHDSVTDYGALPSLLDQTAENLNQEPSQVLGDQGYNSLENICSAYDRNVAPVFASRSNFENELSPQLTPYEQFNYDEKQERYTCLAGKPLAYNSKGRGQWAELARPKDCEKCPLNLECAFFKKGTRSAPAPIPKRLNQMKEHHLRSRTEDYREIYRKRKKIVEPVFGNIKHNKRFALNVVGRSKVQLRFLCMCAAHNIEKICNRVLKNHPEGLIGAVQRNIVDLFIYFIPYRSALRPVQNT